MTNPKNWIDVAGSLAALLTGSSTERNEVGGLVTSVVNTDAVVPAAGTTGDAKLTTLAEYLTGRSSPTERLAFEKLKLPYDNTLGQVTSGDGTTSTQPGQPETARTWDTNSTTEADLAATHRWITQPNLPGVEARGFTWLPNAARRSPLDTPAIIEDKNLTVGEMDFQKIVEGVTVAADKALPSLAGGNVTNVLRTKLNIFGGSDAKVPLSPSSSDGPTVIDFKTLMEGYELQCLIPEEVKREVIVDDRVFDNRINGTVTKIPIEIIVKEKRGRKHHKRSGSCSSKSSRSSSSKSSRSSSSKSSRSSSSKSCSSDTSSSKVCDSTNFTGCRSTCSGSSKSGYCKAKNVYETGSCSSECSVNSSSACKVNRKARAKRNWKVTRKQRYRRVMVDAPAQEEQQSVSVTPDAFLEWRKGATADDHIEFASYVKMTDYATTNRLEHSKDLWEWCKRMLTESGTDIGSAYLKWKAMEPLPAEYDMWKQYANWTDPTDTIQIANRVEGVDPAAPVAQVSRMIRLKKGKWNGSGPCCVKKTNKTKKHSYKKHWEYILYRTVKQRASIKWYCEYISYVDWCVYSREHGINFYNKKARCCWWREYAPSCISKCSREFQAWRKCHSYCDYIQWYAWYRCHRDVGCCIKRRPVFDSCNFKKDPFYKYYKKYTTECAFEKFYVFSQWVAYASANAIDWKNGYQFKEWECENRSTVEKQVTKCTYDEWKCERSILDYDLVYMYVEFVRDLYHYKKPCCQQKKCDKKCKKC
jgi:hypothetical protein